MFLDINNLVSHRKRKLIFKIRNREIRGRQNKIERQREKIIFTLEGERTLKCIRELEK